MNKQRRDAVKTASFHLSKARDLLFNVSLDERFALSNWPDSLRETDRYSSYENCCDGIDKAVDYMDDAAREIEDALNG